MNNKFTVRYFDKLDEVQKVVSQAKRYIVDNWEKIEDWSQLRISVRNNSEYSPNNKKGEHYRPDDLSFGGVKMPSNPVNTLTVVFDDSDGDMSVTINGKEWWFIDDESICTIAGYIEKSISKEPVYGQVEGPIMEFPTPKKPHLTCSYCKEYTHDMMRSGMEPLYSDNCRHPDLELNVALSGGFTSGNLPRDIYGTLVTPDWCPYLTKKQIKE